MEIKTKFNVFDKVYYMHDNVVKFSEITKINITCSSNTPPPLIQYELEGSIHHYDQCRIRNEDEVFATKEELLNSL